MFFVVKPQRVCLVKR